MKKITKIILNVPTDLAADWKSLLDSVNLGEIAAEPILPIDPKP